MRMKHTALQLHINQHDYLRLHLAHFRQNRVLPNYLCIGNIFLPSPPFGKLYLYLKREFTI